MKLPDWMNAYRKYFKMTEGKSIEEILELPFQADPETAMRICAVDAQRAMLEHLFRDGLLLAEVEETEPPKKNSKPNSKPKKKAKKKGIR